MENTHKTRKIVDDFIHCDERILILRFDGLRENVSKHWHQFLKINTWNLLKKTFILTITRNMHSCSLKNALLRWIGVKIGKNVFIASTVTLDPQFPELISIGDNAIIGMFTHIFTHEVTHTHIRLGKVSIGKNALVGALATVRSGVTIEDDSVVGMEAFANEDVPAKTLVIGEPTRMIKKLHAIL